MKSHASPLILVALSACASSGDTRTLAEPSPRLAEAEAELPRDWRVVHGRRGPSTTPARAPFAGDLAPTPGIRAEWVTRTGAPRMGGGEPRYDSNAALRAQLRATQVRGIVMQDEESLRTVIDAIRDQTGLPLVVHPAAENACLDEGILFDFSIENPISVRNALDLVVDIAADEIEWVVRHEAVIVTTREKARSASVVRLHDIQTLTFAKTDFSGPRIDRLRLLDDLEDDDGGGPFGGVGETVRQMEPDDIATMVQENVAVGTWEDEGVSIEAAEGFLIVVHSLEVQAQVTRFLQMIGGF